MRPRAKSPSDETATPAWSAWDVLAGIGDSLTVVDTAYRVVWAKEPLLPRCRPGAEAKLAGEFCYHVFAGRDEVCESHCPVQAVLATGRAQVVERQIALRDGRVLWREARAYPICDGGGRVVLVARIGFAISHRKTQQSLREREHAALERSLEELNRLKLKDLPFQPGSGHVLTARELEVLRLLAQGLSKPQIAGVLSLSPHTVKRHVDHIFAKLDVGDRTQAAVWAARRGLV